MVESRRDGKMILYSSTQRGRRLLARLLEGTEAAEEALALKKGIETWGGEERVDG